MQPNSIRAFHALYDLPLAKASKAATGALSRYLARPSYRRAWLYDKAAEAYQIALYRSECARKVMS